MYARANITTDSSPLEAQPPFSLIPNAPVVQYAKTINLKRKKMSFRAYTMFYYIIKMSKDEVILYKLVSCFITKIILPMISLHRHAGFNNAKRS